MKKPYADYLGFGVVICIGSIVMLMPWSVWSRSFVELGLVALGSAMVAVSVHSLTLARKQEEES